MLVISIYLKIRHSVSTKDSRLRSIHDTVGKAGQIRKKKIIKDLNKIEGKKLICSNHLKTANQAM